MAIRSDERVRMTILGGHLGSGKTTWLRHQLHEGLLQEALIIVNEAAEVPVDHRLLAGARELAVLAGGCACCEARGDLVRLLREVCDVRSGAGSGERLQHIVLETSGLADPSAIAEAIEADPILAHHLLISEIIVAVDALHALDAIRREPLGRAQIETADRLLVTKIDAVKEGALMRLLATLQRLNPGAALSGSVRGSSVDLPPWEHAEPEALSESLPAAAEVPIFATRLDLDPSIDWTAFSVWLSALLHARGTDVLRIKGVMSTPGGRLLLQSVRETVQSPEILPQQPEPLDNVLVVVGRGYRAQDLSRSLRYFASARTAAG